MNHFMKSAGVLGLMMIAGALNAQLSFTNQGGSMLQTISGWSAEDCAVDMNGDNLDDVVRVTDNGIYIDYQQADGTFVGELFPMSVQNMPNWSIAAGDIDGNGYTDLVFGNGSRVSFCMANDDGTDYTEDPRPEYIFSQRSTMADIDNDGHLDVFVCHDVDQSHPYRNDGTGYLVLDQSLIETLDVGGNYAAIWCDYDNDWDIDLYITKCRGGAGVGDPQRINLLYRNNGDGTFSEVGEEANMNDGDQSWTTVFEDFDNDGDFDAFTVNHSWANRLMENNGDGTFTDIIAGSGINANDLGAWNCDAGDFDNNGYVDIFSEMGQEMYLNNGDGTFTAMDLNFDSGGIGDFNNDGFLDVINGNNLWMNDTNDNNYIMFHLEGLVSNKNAIGARVEIYGDFGMQVREVRSGESFSPMSSMSVHFGLGTFDTVDNVVIKWPSGMVTELDNPTVNATNEMIEVGCLLDPSEITASGALTICPGESVELTAVSGADYTWSNGADTQSIEVTESGNYSVIVWADDECASISNTVTIDVVEEEVPTITLDGDDVFCEGGEAILTASIGSGYEWSNGGDQQIIAVTESGEYYVTIDALCEAVELISDPIMITVLDGADAPVATGMTVEPSSVTLEATGENLMWYDAEDAVDAIGEGAEYTTPFLDASTTYWVEANTIYGGGDETGGKATNDGAGGLPSTGAYSYFSALEPFTIQDVRVYVPEESVAGTRTVQLVDANETVLATASFDLEIGEHVLDLGFDVPVGTGFSLRCPENNLFRNSGGVTYPYAIGTVGELYDSFYGGAYYYYFYDWNVSKAEVACASERVAVDVTIVGLEEIEALSAFNLFPNPTSGSVTVEMTFVEAADVSIQLLDITGKVVLNETLNAGQTEYRKVLSLDNVATGLYQFVLNVNGEQLVEKLIVE
ncbi:MAG: FG-GAP-like repeat-containing protein [Flavobacteriales bacterium]|nr:FG-GAP-like repeat-containing protein [Flavobacteriales bacterium]MDG1780080.1 FG-GAP-like repeat-containing protein [Flavobacteriales bacterium]MDG2247260.1 FG-GAP-like repeat-containing protein [Flavobacteriales bacterium]